MAAERAHSDEQRAGDGHQRPVRDPQADRTRRHGRRVLRARSPARPPSRSQGVVPRVRHRRELRRAVPSRGAVSRQPVAPQHRQRLRLGQVRGHLLHRDGGGPGPHPRRSPLDQQAAHVEAGRRDRERGCRRAGIRPRQSRRTSRHQAGQHPHRLERPGEGGRLRDRPGAQRTDRIEPHPGRLGHGHCDVLLARAGAGRPARPAQRPVLARHRDVRDGGRQAAVHRREPGEHRLQAGARRTPAARADRRRRAPLVRGDRREVARQGSEAALSERRRAARRPAPVPQRRTGPGPRRRPGHAESRGRSSPLPAPQRPASPVPPRSTPPPRQPG